MTVALRSLPQAFFSLIKNEGKKSFADWLIVLANCSFGMSMDAFPKSVKKFLDREVRIMSFNNRSRSPPYPVICYVLFPDTRLYFWNRLPDYFASAREAYKVACLSKFMYNYVVIVVSGYWAT